MDNLRRFWWWTKVKREILNNRKHINLTKAQTVNTKLPNTVRGRRQIKTSTNNLNDDNQRKTRQKRRKLK